eukprot:5856565-Amphidinium_carterae.1
MTKAKEEPLKKQTTTELETLILELIDSKSGISWMRQRLLQRMGKRVPLTGQCRYVSGYCWMPSSRVFEGMEVFHCSEFQVLSPRFCPPSCTWGKQLPFPVEFGNGGETEGNHSITCVMFAEVSTKMMRRPEDLAPVNGWGNWSWHQVPPCKW